MWTSSPDISDLEKVIHNFENPTRKVKIGIIGKYTELIESYKSLDEALQHASISNQVEFDPIYIDAEEIEKNGAQEILASIDGILVPGGFGERGTEGKIKAIEYARKNNIPFFGICLGLQLAMIEFARNKASLPNATSEEFDSKGDLIVHYMKGQTKGGSKGGSMRLGAYDCSLEKGSLAFDIYGQQDISERHRHRLEVNNDYLPQIEESGMIVSGKNKKLGLVEVIELKKHPFFIACQYHPEFKSRPFKPHPIFKRFIEAAIL